MELELKDKLGLIIKNVKEVRDELSDNTSIIDDDNREVFDDIETLCFNILGELQSEEPI